MGTTEQPICPPGNAGFPIAVNGFVNVKTTVQPNDLQLQLGPPVSITLNKGEDDWGFITVPGSHSFFLGGTQYFVNVVRWSSPAVSGIGSGSEERLAELHFWGACNKKDTYGLLIVPIFRNPYNSSVFADYSNAINNGEPLNLSKLFPQEEKVLRYTTCIETVDSSPKTINVAQWVRGLGFPLDTAITSKQAPYGIPASLVLGAKLADSYKDTGGKKIIGPGQILKGVCLTYSMAIQADSADYDTRFRMMIYSTRKVQENSTKEYKCMAIDRSKAIQNGRLVINPETGENLDSTLADEEQEQMNLAAADFQEPSVKPRTVEDWASSILGWTLGLFGLALIAIFLKKLTSKNDADMVKQALAVAELAKAPEIRWTDLLLPFFFGVVGICILTIMIVSFLVAK